MNTATDNRPLADRIFGWLHVHASLSLATSDRRIKLFHIGHQTEHGGPGRVLQLSFLGGAGYAPRPDTCTLRGFTIGIRYQRPRLPSSLVRQGMRQPWPLLSITNNPSKFYF